MREDDWFVQQHSPSERLLAQPQPIHPRIRLAFWLGVVALLPPLLFFVAGAGIPLIRVVALFPGLRELVVSAVFFQVPFVLGVIGGVLAASAPRLDRENATARNLAGVINGLALATQFILMYSWQQDPPIS